MRMVCIAFLVMVSLGCRTKYREDLDYSYNVLQTWPLEDLAAGEIVQFESVFWEPDDTVSLRRLLIDDSIASGRDVLEIGTGTGLISIICLQNDAASVVATDINPAAVACAKYNVAMLAETFLATSQLDVRQVPPDSPGAFSVIQDDEKFDLILSNPPWEDGQVTQPVDHAFYDPSFALMDSLLDGLPKHLKPGGRCLLAYGYVPAIQRLQEQAAARGFAVKILDDRELDTLPNDFLPGMLIEIKPPLSLLTGTGRATTASPPADSTEPETP
ncbi:N5-glutamine S-adenosyl-L-methionine-dependent methyltransferase [Rubripirellula lacrimiformis]|uniref:N5-glutamine S-adenosyl-L-methionine-dependent methyltransferase n=1 Tax=Rubripirellula lacrimiformis TaxID=1930273 RepID=A0A517N799_9BACT|nr:methyltransferase [Rubripirellula lacrimiformis]QDT03016.1 N5-glutamine S-adenosyl-L-methionine-dependent methyltransferase [Rubripirellula lacrimiformis]